MISCTLRSLVTEIFSHSRTVSLRLGDNCVSKCSSDSFPHTKYMSSCMENSQTHALMFCCSPILGRRFEKQGKLWGRFVPQFFFFHFMTFSPQCRSDSFTHMVMYILCVKNCQNYISTHSCLPIAGRLFNIVIKLHGPRQREVKAYFSGRQTL